MMRCKNISQFQTFNTVLYYTICEILSSYYILNKLQCSSKFLTFMKTFTSLRINIDCICYKSDLRSIIKNINIKTESIITEYYQKLILWSVFSKVRTFFIMFTSSSLKLIEIDSLQTLIFNADISFFITS